MSTLTGDNASLGLLLSANRPSATANALDLNRLTALRQQAGSSDAATARQATQHVAKELESLFMATMLKHMREALPGDPLASDATRMATSMLDNQLSQTMAEKGMGLADMLTRQLQASQQAKFPTAEESAAFTSHVPPWAAVGKVPVKPMEGASANGGGDAKQVFLQRHQSAASAASAASGIPAKVILGQAALESGWGRHEIRDAKGQGSCNLFGIKAGADWKGRTVDVRTTEYAADGVARKVVQRFRAYDSYEEAFADYTRLLTQNPRYARAMQVASNETQFAQAIGRSGYATDPRYGEKLIRILDGINKST